jgi:hypothetical protein
VVLHAIFPTDIEAKAWARISMGCSARLSAHMYNTVGVAISIKNSY